MIDYGKLAELLKKKESGISLTHFELQEFAKLTREIKTKDYYSFCKAIRPTYKWAWFHQYTINELNDIANKKSGRLLLAIGDQHGKTECAARLYVPYLMGKNPNWKFLYITYSDTRAKEPSAEI